MDSYLFFLAIMFLLAIFMQDRFVISLLYFFLSVFLIGRWWSLFAARRVKFLRTHPSRAFIGESIMTHLEVHNPGWLPLVWMRLQDHLPVELATKGTFKRVISLGPRRSLNFEYELFARKRGIYQVGPVQAITGDLFGLAVEQHAVGAATSLVVFPSIHRMAHFSLPSLAPLGTLRTRQPLFEDPSRVRGKRDYQPGDSLRRIDWKTTASQGRLQVKQFEPSISLETMIFLNLNLAEYDFRGRFEATELAIVAAASIANWVMLQRQAVGLVTNGLHAQASNQEFLPLPPRKGRSHLIHLLEMLAVVQAVEAMPFLTLISQQRSRLAWGTTNILITGSVPANLFKEIFQSRQAGMSLVLVVAGNVPDLGLVRQQSVYFRIPFYHLRHELELESWRGLV